MRFFPDAQTMTAAGALTGLPAAPHRQKKPDYWSSLSFHMTARPALSAGV
jgi:hypothetical protein